ncbi:alpha/beta fold hydrolase [Mycolicibacterium brumae]|uniref:Prolyl aminopeptidase n=1 Tax=Mycolicibacterium brumae TaxID=85968 RepID=A0A2G5PBE8_9MYCO|nr:alpha/beta fold hydrolase [Mycolicibacterium brumae]MCV7193054.1 alpha/beta fold hydrolase [Mycolicibacterium brumae]PIB75370.1 prolyl aminopeptidase [Mycolicibacterium brumae]RWA22021.1 hypothetical protein MBRU_13630 [Mycolicibacterium brumae DSM 44177]UWW07944.1 alpha/beta hydrolase [Mycolicibacterium brumae]
MATTGLERMATAEINRAGGRVRRPAGAEQIDIAYVRPTPSNGTPLVAIPGGPGMGSIVPYRSLRRRAVRDGVDILMMEHRGVGASRKTLSGNDIAMDAVTIGAVVDDLAAVLDHAGIERAVIYGTSYGTYLAQVFGVRHPDRVAAMVLDSPMLSAEGDVAVIRRFLRGLLLDGPSSLATAVRSLLSADLVPIAGLNHVVQVVYEFAGPTAAERLVRARLDGRGKLAWRRIAALGEIEVAGDGRRFIVEPDLVAGIAHGELGLSHNPDGLPFDPVSTYLRDDAPRFQGEPEDLPATLPAFDWPTAVISGDRDLRTPRPVADQVTELIPDAVLVPIADMAHSALDTHPLAALAVARAALDGTLHADGLSARIATLPRKGPSSLLGPLIRAGINLDLAVSGARQRIKAARG